MTPTLMEGRHSGIKELEGSSRFGLHTLCNLFMDIEGMLFGLFQSYADFVSLYKQSLNPVDCDRVSGHCTMHHSSL